MKTRRPLTGEDALELLIVLHQAWYEMDAHQGKCARMDAVARHAYEVLRKHSPTEPPHN